MIALVISLVALGKSTKTHKDDRDEIEHHSVASILPRLSHAENKSLYPADPLPRLWVGFLPRII